MRVEIHRKAGKMLQSITDYYAEVGGMQPVDILLDTIRQKSEWLMKFPEVGTPEPLLANRNHFYRFVILNRNIKMAYYAEGDVIHIAAFWDMRMSPERLKKRI